MACLQIHEMEACNFCGRQWGRGVSCNCTCTLVTTASKRKVGAAGLQYLPLFPVFREHLAEILLVAQRESRTVPPVVVPIRMSIQPSQMLLPDSITVASTRFQSLGIQDI